ncbi:serine protease [Panus rudis PR-1116 ss-1]|nr:serine protease [Panus rudis PR-1116 ss-1]
MRFSAAVITSLALLASPVLGAPNADNKSVDNATDAKNQSYIVVLNDNVSKQAHLNWVRQHLGNNSVTHGDWRSDVLHGFAGKFSEAGLNLLHANPDVKSVQEDHVVYAAQGNITTQFDAPWGLSRMSQDAPLSNPNEFDLNFPYSYNFHAGVGADIYIVDTGINIDHVEFGGRARWGATFGSNVDADENGHGTHVAGIAASYRYGVAKAANLIAVKVLGESGSESDVISGINWVIAQVETTRRPSVVNLSLGARVGPGRIPLDLAVTALVDAGIPATVSAMNENEDAINWSPAHTPEAITVGATTIADARAPFSNFGSVLDIFAPGLNIISTWIGSTTAAPHVAGLIAYLFSVEGKQSPSAVADRLQDLALKNVITGIPAGTPNILARNDVVQ